MSSRFCSVIGILTVVQLLLVAHSSAQDADNVKEFGAVISKAGTVRNKSALFIGGQGGWNFDRSFAVGIGGYMMLNNIVARVPDSLGNHDLTLSYGGVTLDYLVPIGESFYAVVQMLIGGGAIGHKETRYLDRRQYHDPFFIVEPGITIDMAISKIFRIGIGASYRGTAWLKSDLATQSELNSFSGNLSLKAGFF